MLGAATALDPADLADPTDPADPTDHTMDMSDASDNDQDDQRELQTLADNSSRDLQRWDSRFQFDLTNIAISDSDEETNETLQVTEQSDLLELRERMDLELGGNRAGRRDGKRRRRARGALAPHLAHLMAEANGAYISQEFDEATSTLQELIRHAPRTLEAWTLLTQIYTETGHDDKALAACFVATHVAPKRVELYVEAGRLARRLGRLEVALQCYRRVLRTTPGDLECLLERARVLVLLERPERAADAYGRVMRAAPAHVAAACELARVLAGLNRGPAAVEAMEAARRAAPAEEFGFAEYDLLGELLMDVAEYDQAAQTIRAGAAQLLGIGGPPSSDEAFIATLVERQLAVPLELQARLGICRLIRDGHDAVAQQYFQTLFAAPRGELLRVYYDVIGAYLKLRLYARALELLKVMNEWPLTSTPLTWEKMALCYQHLQQPEAAAQLYTFVVASIPDHSDAKLALASVLQDLGEDERALALIDEIEAQLAASDPVPVPEDKAVEKRRRTAAREASRGISETAHAERGGVSDDEDADYSGASGDSDDESKDGSAPKTPTVKAVPPGNDVQAARETALALAKCELLYRKLGNAAACADLCRTAARPAGRFLSHQPFFRHLRVAAGRPWSELSVSRVFRRWSMSAAGDLAGDAGEHELDAEDDADAELAPWLGLPPRDWYRLLMMYATACARSGEPHRALAILDRAAQASLFRARARGVRLRLLMLVVAAQAGERRLEFDLLRWLCNNRAAGQADFWYRCFTAFADPRHPVTLSLYSASQTVRWCQRQLQLREERHSGECRAPAMPEFDPDAPPAAAQCDADAHSPVLPVFVAQQFSATRFYSLAMQHYLRAFVSAPNDPLMNLCMGVACLSRAMQRQTEDRHRFVAQSVAFLGRYARQVQQRFPGGGFRRAEALYNVARAMHQLGLVHLSLRLYEQCLSEGGLNGPLPSGDDERLAAVKAAAAYNLHLIYAVSASPHLAQQVLERHCTF